MEGAGKWGRWAGDGVLVSIDIHGFASGIVDLSRLEAEGSVFGLVRAGGSGKRAG